MARIGRVLSAAILASALVILPLTGTITDSRAASTSWTGGIDLYRSGVFSTQKTFLWCTAADVQIARNIVFHRSDHSRSSQQAYFDWMRRRNRYAIPLKDGVDPQGWAAGMRQFVDARYRLVASRSFDVALRSAVISLRRTSRPVGVIVARGEHAWLLTGFTATADPARTTRFTVTSVRVVGPLYGIQSRNGYDMPPDTRLSVASFRRFFTPFDDRYVRMVWKGFYVSIQASGATGASSSTRSATMPAGEAAHPLSPPPPRPTAAALPRAPVASAMPGSLEAAGSAAPGSSAAGVMDQPTEDAALPSTIGPTTSASQAAMPVSVVLIALAAVVAAALIGLTLRLRRT